MQGKNHAASSSHGDALAAGKFMLGILALFLLFSFLVSLLPLESVEMVYAAGTLAALGIFGLDGEVVAQEPALLLLDAFALPIGISYLCTGLLELTIIWAAMGASFGVDLRKRAIGIIAGTVALVAFNFARIIGSILIIHWFGLDAGNFGHDVLFRVFLFITIAGYYYCWFRWATGQKNGKKASKKAQKA
ncbi:MAG TPA: exosortase/archaeosortase family protein [archaeon]|nr:exosortase/archaeosortase family protein [archaeon]